MLVTDLPIPFFWFCFLRFKASVDGRLLLRSELIPEIQ
jgi:hypothetical protein